MTDWLDDWLSTHEQDLVEVRRQLHMRPELGWEERATTALLVEQLEAAGLAPKRLARGTGVVCDLPSTSTEPTPLVVLRADIDALPLQDEKEVPYRSRTPGLCHACGHDVHTAAVLGAGLALAQRPLPGHVRLVFQPAEELMPGGAVEVISEGWVAGATSIFGLHCDPALEVGRVGLRTGPITAAADMVEVVVTGPGGHTSRPHNTVDVVHVLSTVATGLPAALSRLVDPRAGLALVWGQIQAGRAHNAIPTEGRIRGTLRVLDRTAWQSAPDLVERLVRDLVTPYGARATVHYERGVPPVVNDAAATALLTAAVKQVLGPGAAVPTAQSLGGEDFAWYLEDVPGCMARLGVKPPGLERPVDLHQGRFDVDEGAIAVGVRVLATAALAALDVA